MAGTMRKQLKGETNNEYTLPRDMLSFISSLSNLPSSDLSCIDVCVCVCYLCVHRECRDDLLVVKPDKWAPLPPQTSHLFSLPL